MPVTQPQREWVAEVFGLRFGATALKPTADDMRRDLAGLIGRIAAAAGTDEARKALLAKLAGDANAAIKANDLSQAGRLVAELRGAIEPPSGTAAKTMPIWRDARDETGDQFNKLSDAMRKHGMPLFRRIADRGLNGITETRLVAMQEALMELDSAAGEKRPAAVDKVKAAIADMRGFIQSNPVLPILERNPLKVPVTLRATLTGALDAIDKVLAA